MKTIQLLKWMALVSVVCVLYCSSNPPNTGIEVTNGNCVGKIYNKDSTPATGALVRLIPCDFEPASSSSSALDSTYTDKDGRYTFTVGESNYYNIIAEKDDASCMQDSVSVLTDATSYVDNDTLEASGGLTGRITVKPGDDPRAIVILIQGTDIYTIPYDSLGNFVTPPLPAGEFSVIIFTTANGYAMLDTAISIVSGMTTELTAQLPTLYAPTISDLKVTYDTTAMFASLRWTPPDTSLFQSYALHRITGSDNDSLLLIDKNKSSFIDDLVRCEGDTVTYELTAVGKNFKEGYKADAPAFVACSKAVCIETVTFPELEYSAGYFYVDTARNIYIVNRNTIEKYDSDGTKITEYVQADFDIHKPLHTYLNYCALQGDRRGNIYAVARPNYDSGYAPVVIKLDADLRLRDQLIVPDSVLCVISDGGYPYRDMTITVADNGEIYLVTHGLDDRLSTRISVYDSGFVYLRGYEVMDDKLYLQKIEGTTIFATCPRFQSYTEYKTPIFTTFILTFDTSFTRQSEIEAVGAVDNYCGPDTCPAELICSAELTVVNNDLYLTGTTNGTPNMVMVIDGKGRLRARFLLPFYYRMSFMDTQNTVHFLIPAYADDYGRIKDGLLMKSFSLSSLLTK